MDQNTTYRRSSGILAHISSLPSPYGIGDLGSGATRFLRFLADSGQSIWQILPLGPTHPSASNSPYMTVSAFAGNPLLIAPELLLEDGLLSRSDLADIPEFSPYTVEFGKVTKLKGDILQRAFNRFTPDRDPEYQVFLQHSERWLEDYCRFMAMKDNASGLPWYEWEEGLKFRKPESLKRFSRQFERQIDYYRFEQFQFWKQWRALRKQAGEHDIELFGDIPIYVSLDSADVWANQDIFQLDEKTGLPSHVAGVPPDYFSETGQKWGNPLYRWNNGNPVVSEALLDWWTERFRAVFELVDIARIDHFRGFQAYWSVPAQDETALDGSWQKGPGSAFFQEIRDRLGPLKIVAEDLGDIDDDVIALREACGFPGMRVLQFAFDGNRNNSFLPWNYESANSFVYTGTHDNNTTVGWYFSDKLDDGLRSRVKQSANRELHDNHGIHCDLIYLAMSSTAVTSIYPLQDVLGFGEDCRMNMPGTSEENWAWRCCEDFLTAEISGWLFHQTELFGRTIEKIEDQSENLSEPESTNP